MSIVRSRGDPGRMQGKMRTAAGGTAGGEKQQSESEESKMKKAKKISALVLVLVMVLAVSVTAMAEGPTVKGDYSATEGTHTTPDNDGKIPLTKTVVYLNPDSKISVRQPDITFSYAVEPATVGTNTTVTSVSGDPTSVSNGVAGGVTAPSDIVISSDTAVTVSSNGTPKVYTTTMGVDITKFSRAGIYRYKITESANPAVAEAGITRSEDYSADRYLDVYIKNAEGGGLELMGAVIFKDNTSISATGDNVYTGKTTGYDVTTADNDYADDAGVDRYFTYNLTVNKTTNGNMADKTHQFPITINISKATGLTNDATVDVSVNDNATLPSGAATAALGTAVSISATMKDGGELYIKGIAYFPGATPAYATINSVTETNDTSDYYTPKITQKTNLKDGNPVLDFDNDTIAPSASKSTTGSASLEAGKYSAMLKLTNVVSAISPTGYITRFAPYALILVGGIVLLIISKKHRKHTDEE